MVPVVSKKLSDFAVRNSFRRREEGCIPCLFDQLPILALVSLEFCNPGCWEFLQRSSGVSKCCSLVASITCLVHNKRCHTVTGGTEATPFLAASLIYTAHAVDTTSTVHSSVIDSRRLPLSKLSIPVGNREAVVYVCCERDDPVGPSIRIAGKDQWCQGHVGESTNSSHINMTKAEH